MIAAWMLFALVTGAALSVAAVAAERLAALSRRPVRVVWLVAMAATAAWPLGVVLLARTMGTPAVPEPASALARGAHRLTGIVVTLIPTSDTARHVDVALLAAWTVASAFLLARLVVTTAVVGRWRRAWPAVEVDGVRVRVSSDVGPAVVGLRPMEVVLPAWALALDGAERALVLRHETEHRAAGDPHVLLLAAVIAALVPWHVGLWWQARRLRLAVELDCDARVLRAIPRSAGYARLLLRIAERRPARALRHAPALSAPTSHLERRILAMYAPTRGTSHLRLVALGAAACAAVAVACSVDAPNRPTAPARTTSTDASAAIPGDAPPESRTGAFFEFQVDREATTLPGGVTVHYPEELKNSGLAGQVLTEFVVDTTGRAEMSTVRVMTSSHPAFTAAVRAALPTWRFRPAAVRGHAVRQLVQLPVFIAPPRTPAAG